MCAPRRPPPFRRTSHPPFVFGFLFLFRAFFATALVRLALADDAGKASTYRSWRGTPRSIARDFASRITRRARSQSSEFAGIFFRRPQY
jgi:hypothetical protein